MTKSILTTGGIPTVTTANSTQYWSLAVTSIESPLTNETNKQIIYRTAGTISKLYVKITANTINGTSSINIRNNGANAGLSLTVGANATGVFENTVDTLTVAANDKLNYQTVPGAATGTMSISIFSVLFEATTTTDTLSRLSTSGIVVNFNTASVSRYNQIGGSLVAASTEALAKCKIRKAATGKNLAVYVSGNTRVNDTLVRTRKNGADGACLTTITPGLTGWFEDTTNSDTLAVGDDYYTVLVSGTGTETLNVQSISLDLVTTSGHGQTINARGAGFNISAGATHYFPIGGAINAGTTELGAQQKTRMNTYYSELIFHINTNTVTADSTLKLRKNGVDSSIVVTVPASTAGYFSDSTNTELFTAEDDISLQLIAGATGTTLNLRSISLVLSQKPPALKTISETQTIGESRTRNKAAWRLQP